MRDYIHVVDLALGHLKALARLQDYAECRAINLGTGVGYSVLDMVRAFELASDKPVPYQVAPRRAGDIASCYTDPARLGSCWAGEPSAGWMPCVLMPGGGRGIQRYRHCERSAAIQGCQTSWIAASLRSSQ